MAPEETAVEATGSSGAVELGAVGKTPSNSGSERVTFNMRSKVSEDISDDISSADTSLCVCV